MMKIKSWAAMAASTCLTFSCVAAIAPGASAKEAPLDTVEAMTAVPENSDTSQAAAESLGVLGKDPVEASEILAEQGFERKKGPELGTVTYSKPVENGMELRVDAPDPDMATAQAMAVKWDPLPYLVGTGKDWGEMVRNVGAAGAAAACAPFGAAAVLCGAAVGAILEGAIEPSKLENQDKCYVMKAPNVPPEEVSRDQCTS